MSRAFRSASSNRLTTQLLAAILGLAVAAHATDWSGPEQQLARKIATISGSAPVSLTFENHSSLGARDREIIQNGLRTAMEGIGTLVREQATTAVKISLSENLSSYVWVAEVRKSADEGTVVMVSMPRPASFGITHDPVPLTLRKIPLWNQAEQMLDVVVLEENTTPIRIAVLEPDRVCLYRMVGGKWQREQTMEISHERPWPRDLRGRLLQGRDHLLDAYLPGFVCHSNAAAPFSLMCREGDDPWPLMVPGWLNSASTAPNTSSATVPTHAFFAPFGNFFTGALTPGKFATVPQFYSATVLPRDGTPLSVFAGLDRQVHIYDGVADHPLRLNWGSDIAGVRTACGAGWQILATSADDGSIDSVRAFEVPERDPVMVSGSVEFSGAIRALWTEGKGDTAVVIAKVAESEDYEAFRLAVACGQ